MVFDRKNSIYVVSDRAATDRCPCMTLSTRILHGMRFSKYDLARRDEKRREEKRREEKKNGDKECVIQVQMYYLGSCCSYSSFRADQWLFFSLLSLFKRRRKKKAIRDFTELGIYERETLSELATRAWVLQYTQDHQKESIE